MYLHKELETLTRPEIEKLQLERLQKTVRHCMNSPFYKQRFAENHLSPEDIRSLDDLQKIPFTTKQDLRDTYIIRKSKFPQNPKRSVRFSGKRTKRSVQKRKARNTQKAETKVL